MSNKRTYKVIPPKIPKLRRQQGFSYPRWKRVPDPDVEDFLVPVKVYVPIRNFKLRSSLNGNNGSWTNTDDVKGKRSSDMRQETARMKKIEREQKKESQELRSLRQELQAAKRALTRNPHVQSIARGVRGLSAEAHAYMLARIDARAAHGMLPHVVGGTPIPTQKVAVRGQVQVVVGSNGFGWLFLHPAAANNIGSITYTTATYAGNVTDTGAVRRGTATATTGVSGVALGTPYTLAQLQANDTTGSGGSAAQARLVAMTGRLQYTGNLLNKNGTVFAIDSTRPLDVSGYQQAQILNDPMGREYEVCVDPEMIISARSFARHQEDCMPCAGGSGTALTNTFLLPHSANLASLVPYFEYVFGGGTAASSAAAAAGMLIIATAGTQFSFQYEAFVEYAGELPGSLCTETAYDVEGHQAAIQASHDVGLQHALNPRVSHGAILAQHIEQKGYQVVESKLKALQSNPNPYIAGGSTVAALGLQLAQPALKGLAGKAGSEVERRFRRALRL